MAVNIQQANTILDEHFVAPTIPTNYYMGVSQLYSE